MNQTWLIAIITGAQTILFLIFKTTYAGAVKSKFDESLEEIKAGFTRDINTEIAKLQASLSKINISHQIVTSEYTKYKFDKIASLNKALLDLLKCHNDVHKLFRNSIKSMSDIDNALDNLYSFKDKVTFIISETSLFISSGLEKEIITFFNLGQTVIDHLVVLGNNQLKIYNLENKIETFNDRDETALRDDLKINLDKLDELRLKLREDYASIKSNFKTELKNY